MFESTPYSTIFFIVIMIVLSGLICLCLLRAVLGPRFTDRLVAANMIGTMTIVFVCILAVFLEEGFLADVALIYAILSYLAVVVISRIIVVKERNEETRNITKLEVESRDFEEAKKK
ncbi:MAG: hypothetical protein K6F23_01170 [Solobacterium sp.]|nr:hypothetical protein [Solobacterium sp.]